jgi:hypothetical protein
LSALSAGGPAELTQYGLDPILTSSDRCELMAVRLLTGGQVQFSRRAALNCVAKS